MRSTSQERYPSVHRNGEAHTQTIRKLARVLRAKPEGLMKGEE
jgi:hypothetical protein